MDNFVKTMFANGENNGDITIKCTDGVFTCHSFVVCNVCPTLKTMFVYVQKTGHSTILADYMTKTMKYLISILYDSSLGEKEGFSEYVLLRPDVEKERFAEFVLSRQKTESYPESCQSLDIKFIVEYVSARDYFGIEYGVYNDIPISTSPRSYLLIISRLPDTFIYTPMKEGLYKKIYDDIDNLDLDSDSVKSVFENPSISMEVAKLYKKKLEEYKRRFVF